MDISIISPEGEEIEPEAAVQVDMKIKDLPGVKNLNDVKDTIEIQHHVETEKGVIVESVYDGGLNASFKQDTVENIASKKVNKAVDPYSVNFSELENLNAAELPEIDASFETEAFSTYTISYYYNYYSKNVHYVDTNGSSLTPTMTPNFNARHQFLIYDIEGYEYDSTHVGSRTGTSIAPILRASNDYGLYSSRNIQYRNGNNWSNLNNNDIYVVYKKKTAPTTGGTVQPAGDQTWPDGTGAPQFSKSSINNGNGTNTISLSIRAAEKEIENASKANVIVVFDRSGSMRNNMAGTLDSNDLYGTENTRADKIDARARLSIAAKAVNSMANTLLNKKDAQGNPLVKMALVTFSTDAEIEQSFTSNYTTFSRKVNAITASGGTNWEKALAIANRMGVDSDAATFIVFVTDGDPTFRMSRGNLADNQVDAYYDDYYGNSYQYYISNNVFGAGTGTLNDNYNSRNFDAAVNEAKTIISSNKNFYAVGVSDSVTSVRNLVTQAGGSSDNAFLASNEEALKEAFEKIASSISTTLGFGDVSMTDGITNLTNAEMKVMQDVDPSSFKYYRYGGTNNKYGIDESHKTEWTTRESDGCGAATYEDGAVKWNMGEDFQLEDGVTYIVEFIVWPKQKAYDLVADLNNGVKVYAEGSDNSITSAERAQIVEIVKADGTKTYALKTNTEEVNATYKKTTKSGDVVSTTDTVPSTATYHEGKIENMGLESELLTVKKTFEDDLTSGSDRMTSVTLKLKRRVTDTGEYVDYQIPIKGIMKSDIVLDESNDWQVQFYVAPGFKSSTNTNINEKGYQFTVTEPGIDYHYDLVEEVINPMIIDGTLQWIGDVDGNSALTAVNRVKSGIDVQKLVYDTDGMTQIYPDTEFTITGKLLDKNGNPYTWKIGDSEDASGAYDIFVPDPTSSYHYPEHPYTVNGVQYDAYKRTQHKLHFENTNNFSFTLKAGEFLRFINVPEGCTFQFTESTNGMDALGYEWKSTEAITQHRTGPGEDFVTDDDVQPLVAGQTATLSTGVVGNKQYAITYGNKRTIALPDVELVKVDQDDNTKKLNGAEFTLYSDAALTTPVTVDGNGNPIAIVTGNKEESAGPDGWYHIGLLSAGTYYLVETVEPTGYVRDETPIIIRVSKGTNSYSVTATKNGTNVLSGPTEGIYTISVDNIRAKKYVKVFKYETGTNPEKSLEGAQFTLTGPEGSDISDTGLTTNTNGYLEKNGSIYLELPVNANNYTLTETKAPDGYLKMTEDVEFTVSTNGVSATGYIVEEAPETVGGVETTVYTIKVQNTPGQELPMTGGFGTLPYTLGGFILMISALMYGFMMRRRERRLM